MNHSIKVGYHNIRLAANALPDNGVGVTIRNVMKYERGPTEEIKMYATTKSGTEYCCIVTPKGKKIGYFEVNSADRYSTTN